MCQLSGCQLSGCQLSGCQLSGCQLSGRLLIRNQGLIHQQFREVLPVRLRDERGQRLQGNAVFPG
ncbi:pentapeptide repeat-containing protein [Methanosarcinaceae archaeon]|nr:pentapeptide repeat-containing protein [Methanosarcinaceae archaeon]